MVSGVTERVVVGVLNEGNETIFIKNFTGALITVQQSSEPEGKPKLNYAQNFTIDSSFKGAKVAPGESFSLAYDIFAFTSLPASRDYNLQLVLFYADSQYEYSSIVIDQSIFLIESDQSINPLTGLLSLIFTGVIVFLIGFVIYVKIQDRFFPQTEVLSKKRKSNHNPGLLEQLRELISNQ